MGVHPHPRVLGLALSLALSLALPLASLVGACADGPDRPATAVASGTANATAVPSSEPPSVPSSASSSPDATAWVAARGRDRLLPPRPPSASGRVCSRRQPVCVHAEGTPPAAVLGLLEDAERALDGLAALRLPAPLPDFDRGGGPELDVYVVGGAREDGAELASAIADLHEDHRTWDAAPAFVLAPARRTGGCFERADLARAIAMASLFGRDAGVEEALGQAAASHLAALVAPCGLVELTAIDAFQRAPERGLDRLATDEGGAAGGQLFFAHLEQRYGSGRPGELTVSLVGAAPQRTPAGAARFQNEPDVVDVLRSNAKAGGSPPFGELLRDFAVERAFVGSRSDDQHLVDVARFEEGGRVRFDWSVTYGSLPRTLAPARPLLPTGASYVWIDLREAPGGSAMTLVASWEPPVTFRWAVVKVGLEGDERGRIEPPTQLGATEIQQSLVDLHGLAGLLVVGVNEGGSSAIDPYDPDDGPYDGQAYTLTLHPE